MTVPIEVVAAGVGLCLILALITAVRSRYAVRNALYLALGTATYLGVLAWSEPGPLGSYELRVSAAALGAALATLAAERERAWRDHGT